jgi:lipid-A-disaccharide synthase
MATAPLLIVAAEASADLHAAQVVRELRAAGPSPRCYGVGGPELRALGLEAVGRAEDLSVMGLWEVLARLPVIKRAFDALLARARRDRPAAALLIDYPGFNFRLMKRLHALGIPVVYYICPQVWAWHEERVADLARYTARRLVIFPFEEAFYRARGVEARYVGHPLLDVLPAAPPPPPEGRGLRVGLFPGSRWSEIGRLLPGFGCLAVRAREQFPGVRFILFPAPTVDAGRLRRLLPPGLAVETAGPDRYAAMAGLHFALMASGTITLEAALLGVPGLVGYRIHPLTYRLMRSRVKVPHISIVNLLLGREVFAEFLQDAFGSPAMEEAFLAALASPERRAAVRRDALALRERLRGGAAFQVAAEMRQYWTA